MKIVSLLENTTRRADLFVEHGLSLYIETREHKILFDMGQTDLFLQNARTLGVDLSAVDLAILSHGHYDHGGGLSAFLKVNDHAPVFVHRDAFLPHYNGTEKYIGLEESIRQSPRLILTEQRHELDSHLTLDDCNDRKKKHPLLPSGLTERVEDRFIADDFRHEQYLLIEEEGTRVLISGCSHKGIRNLVSWFSPDVLIGGFHYSKLPLDEHLIVAAKELSDHSTRYYTCHCTGLSQYEWMKPFLPQLQYLSCGDTLEI